MRARWLDAGWVVIGIEAHPLEDKEGKLNEAAQGEARLRRCTAGMEHSTEDTEMCIQCVRMVD
jgi:hypothetical protein